MQKTVENCCKEGVGTILYRISSYSLLLVSQGPIKSSSAFLENIDKKFRFLNPDESGFDSLLIRA